MRKFERIPVVCHMALVLTGEFAARIATSSADAYPLLTGQATPDPNRYTDECFSKLYPGEYAYPEFYKRNPHKAMELTSANPFGLADTSLAAFLIQRHAMAAFNHQLPVREIALFDGTLMQLYPDIPDRGVDSQYAPELHGQQTRPVLRYIDVADFGCLKCTIRQFLTTPGADGKPLLAEAHEHRITRFLADINGTGIDLTRLEYPEN